MENKIQYDIIKLMNNLKEVHSSKSLQDVFYLDSINYEETHNGQSYIAQKDIFMLVEEKDGIKSYKFYDEKQHLIAVDLGNGQGIMATSNFFKERDLEFTKSTLASISNLDPKISLKEIDEQLEEYSKTLGISKDKILSASSIDLDKEISEKTKKEDLKLEDKKDKIDLEDKSTNVKENNENTLNHISAKEEVDVDETVTGKETLAKILGIPAGCKLIAVYSENIVDNHNTAEFSFIIKRPDGTLESADMLNQVEGNLPDKSISAINRDGSEVIQKQVNSMFSIDSTSNTHDMLTITRGPYGTLDLDYTLIDPTDNNRGRSIPLETEHIQPITKEVRDEMNYTKDDRYTTRALDEKEETQKSCKEYNCNQELTLDDVDGDPNTGHHLSINSVIDELMKVDEISNTYNRTDIKNFCIQLSQEKHDISIDELKDIISKKAELEHELYPRQNR